MAAQRILITKRVYPEAVDFLQSRFEVDYESTDTGLDTAGLLSRSKGCAAVVSQLTDKLSADVIEQLDSSVKVLAQVAVGYDNIDVPAATRRGLLVTNTPGVLTETTADFAWALLMAAARRIPEAHAFVHEGRWKTWLIDLLAGPGCPWRHARHLRHGAHRAGCGAPGSWLRNEDPLPRCDPSA